MDSMDSAPSPHDHGAADHRADSPFFDRREALFASARLALGGVLGGLLASSTGCRSPQNQRDAPDVKEGVPSGYIIDPAICTHNFDCARVCPCAAIGFGDHAVKDGPVCRQCYIDLDKCCACGRCFRVCPDNAIVPTYGPDKIPAREIGRAPKTESG
jgi:ferredoxin